MEPSSQPTYEELKPAYTALQIKLWLSSQPTYEELKLLDPAPQGPLFDGSQPTYEELKHRRRTQIESRENGFPAYL